jgi:hypothetical protein
MTGYYDLMTDDELEKLGSREWTSSTRSASMQKDVMQGRSTRRTSRKGF